MPRSVSVFYSNIRTGTNVSVQRRLVDVTYQWVGNDGQPHTGTRTVTFPDDLALIPAGQLADLLLQLMLTVERANQAVDA